MFLDESRYFNDFNDFCLKRKIQNRINRVRYNEMRKEYDKKILWWKQEIKCVNWLYDNEKKFITAARLRNWMENAIKFQKEYELKKMQERTDKKFYQPQRSVKYKAPEFDELEEEKYYNATI